MLPVLFFGITAVAGFVAYVMSEESEIEKQNHYVLANYRAELEKIELENIQYRQRLLEESNKRKDQLKSKLNLLNNERIALEKSRLSEKIKNISNLIDQIDKEIISCNDSNIKNELLDKRNKLYVTRAQLYQDLSSSNYLLS